MPCIPCQICITVATVTGAAVIIKRNKMNFLKKIFKGKTELEKLEDQHKDLLGQAFLASKTNRTLSDTLTYEASKIEEKIIELRKNETN